MPPLKPPMQAFVRTLAQRSARSAKAIENRINGSVSHVDTGFNLVKSAATGLNSDHCSAVARTVKAHNEQR